MFGFLKKLGRKAQPAPAPAVLTTSPVTAPAPSVPVSSRTVLPPTSSRPEPPAPAAKLPLPAAEPVSAVAAAAAAPSTETVDLPLKQLWPKLNPAVVQLAASQPDRDSMLRVPLNLVHAHLARGSFKIPYAQLRQFATPGLFPANPSKDAQEVEIPISEIVPRLKPEHLSRRPGQKTIVIPDDIESIFGPDGGPIKGLRIADDKKPAAKPSPPPAAAAPSAPIVPKIPVPVAAPTPVLPPPPSPTPTPIPAPAAVAPDPAPVLPVLNEEPIRAPKLDPSLATLRPKASEPAFTLALMDVAVYWSEKGKTELSNLYRHSLEIPMGILEAALKTGKIEFKWREVRPWVRLAPGNMLPTIPDDLPVELPLSIVAPRFMEHRGGIKPQKKVEVSAEIPDVFAIKPGAPAAAPAAAAEAAPAETTAAKPMLEYGDVFGQPDKKTWSLGEVTQRTTTLRGVTGAIIATADGLLVAGSWPGGVNSEAVAAFVPQMYNRMLQYTRELKLGEPGNLTLLVDNVPLQIFKTPTSYFTVLGRAGENLPKVQLNAIAARLATTSK